LIQYNSDTVFPRVSRMAYRAIRTQRWKFIRYVELEGMNELYDLNNDPYEMQNLIREPIAHSVLSGLNLQLDDILKD
jgi:N-acetylglucosamine-6-sulfatase